MTTPQTPTPSEETTEENFQRHVRHYLAKSLIRLDELENAILYPGTFKEPEKIVRELKRWTLSALNAAHGETHAIPNTK